MARTTIDIDGPVLRDLKRMKRQRGKTLGRLVNELLAKALASERSTPSRRPKLRWKPRPMGIPRIDLRDKDALWAILDADEQADRDR